MQLLFVAASATCVVFVERFTNLEPSPGGGGYLGHVLLGMCRWPLRTPTPL